MSFSKEKLVAGGFLATVFGLVVATSYGHTDPAGTQTALEDLGMKNISIQGGAHGACREWYKTKFTATTAKGAQVEGVVCKGPWSGPAVRIKK